MTYYAYDENGYLGDVASNFGWYDLAQAFRKSGKTVLRKLGDNGYSEELDALIKALSVKPNYLSHNVSTTWDNFLTLAKKAQGVLIISDTDESDSEDEDDDEPPKRKKRR